MKNPEPKFLPKLKMWKCQIQIGKELYTDTLSSKRKAETWIDRMIILRDQKCQPGGRNANKRTTAIAKDLPIGLYEHCYTKRNSTYDSIKCQIRKDGNSLKTITAHYGINRTRDEAISIVVRKRVEWVREHFRLVY